ncbi:MAG: VWA domain-containing protein [Actinomycetota bacterium]|nr:VWA domain-containing protein [Actinomycetota bacterium]
MGPDVARVAAALGDELRRAGLTVPPDGAARFAAALVRSRALATGELYWIGRVTFVGDVDDIEIYDRVFARLFGSAIGAASRRGESLEQAFGDRQKRPPASMPEADRVQRQPSGGPDGPQPLGDQGLSGDDRGPSRERDAFVMTASVDERLRHRDFADASPDELARLAEVMAELAIVLPLRPGRRPRGARRDRRIDRRATLRRAHRSGGDPVRLVPDRARPPRPRRLVLLADVSGSMAPYTRAYLHLLHAAVRATRAEAFVFATHLTRLTPALRHSAPDVALAEASLAADDWSSGTRIGASMETFLDEWGRRGLARGAVIVIVSDGWEGDGDGTLLGEQMGRLARLAHKIVWVNPRSQSDRWEPKVAGMAAALPHVDTLVSGHSLAAVHDVLAAIADTA